MTTEQQNTAAIENLITSFIESWNAKDIEKFALLFAENSDFVGVTGLWTTGRGAIAAQHKENFGNMQSQSRLKIVETRVRLLSDRHAVAHSRWEMSGQQSIKGEKLPVKQGVWTIVAESPDKEQWQIITLHNSNVVPPEQAHPDLIQRQ